MASIATSSATGSVLFQSQQVNGSYTNTPSIQSNIFFTDPWGNFQQVSDSANVCGSGVTRIDTSNSSAVACTSGGAGFGLYLAFPQTINVALISTATGNYDSGSKTDPTTLSEFSTGIVTINSGTTQGAVGGTNNNNVNTTPSLTAAVSGDVIFSFSESPTSAPEPATLTLLGMGLIGLAAARRRGTKTAD